jgi:putative methionine-R-sulfoxide reductase with GAF domain
VGDRPLPAAVLSPGAERPLGAETLYAVIRAVGASPDLDAVLAGIVDVLTEATGCHACFVYMRDGEVLRLRAASGAYAGLAGSVHMGLGEGLTGWVARNNRPAFIRDNAMEDPRFKYVPELEEERFQSMVAVPTTGRSGDVIGVIVLHTVAPREFDEATLDFLVHASSLVSGAIENARLYEEARRRVEALTALARLSQDIAAATGREALYRAVCGGVRAMLAAPRCELHLLERDGRRLELVAADPVESGSRVEMTSVVLSTGDEEVGRLSVGPGGGPDRDWLLHAVANQVALALKKAELIERLTAENLVRDLFEALASGSPDVAVARARAAGADLDRPHVVVHGESADGARPWPAVAEQLEAGLRRLSPGAFVETGRERLQALLPLAVDDVGELCRQLDPLARGCGAAVGLSGVRRGALEGSLSLREAADAARVARGLARGGGAFSYGELGAYKYLVHLPAEDAPRDRYRDAVERLLDYDVRRHTHLVETLEEYLRTRTSIAATARALFIHPNTLRQRLGRIERLGGLNLDSDDLLSLELALKLGRLRRSAGSGASTG